MKEEEIWKKEGGTLGASCGVVCQGQALHNLCILHFSAIIYRDLRMQAFVTVSKQGTLWEKDWKPGQRMRDASGECFPAFVS